MKTTQVRLSLIVLCCVALLLCAVALSPFLSQTKAAPKPLQVDVLIRHGKVVDGTGKKPHVADVGVQNDRIVFIGDAAKSQLTAAHTIDASGLIVAPGFIDPHTHTLEDLSSPQRKGNENYLMQGVTTVVTGNDGASAISIANTLDKWERQGIGTNAILLAGHGTIRRQVMGNSDAEPTPAQLAQMKQLMAQAMDDGAFGMSTGLYYAPGSYAKTEEIIELAKIVAAKGGIYDTHMRDESSYSIGLLGSIKETIRIGREAHIPVHISHIKALGTDVWGQSTQAIKLIKQARAQGVDVTANQYPYNASGTSLAASLLPRWAEAGTEAEARRRLDDPALHTRLLAEMEANLKRRGGPESLLFISARDHTLVGQTLGKVAAAQHKSPIDAALEMLKTDDYGVASFNMNEHDIENFMRQKFVMTGSDGSTGHPRKYGTFPRKLREYVYNKKVITLPFAIQHSSALTAETFRIPERGLLRVGYFADIIIFDERSITDRATYEQPELLAEGMRYVLVNGKLAVEAGRYTGTLAGHPLKKR